MQVLVEQFGFEVTRAGLRIQKENSHLDSATNKVTLNLVETATLLC